MMVSGGIDLPFFLFTHSVPGKPCVKHLLCHLKMELEGVRQISEAKGLMGIFLRRGQEYSAFREIEGFAVPLEDRKSLGESPNQGIVFTLFSHRHFVPPHFLFIAPI